MTDETRQDRPASPMSRPPWRTDDGGSGTDEIARRQNEALGKMMGADSARIDGLVGDVGEIKGRVESVHHKVDRMDGKVDKLTDALAAMVRHEVEIDHQRQDQIIMATRVDKLEQRQTVTEQAIGPLQEMRTWAVRGILGVLGAVGLAVLLVVIKGAP